jgi:pimeloyl-ACP methyl ester carboxylesterase
VFDLRGTGLSTPITCKSLQNYTGTASGSAFDTLVGNCGTQLNQTWKNSAGNYVHASDQFDTANAARDLNAALGALGQSDVDLYGDSYGSWFAQSFASRYPGDLRSVTLDDRGGERVQRQLLAVACLRAAGQRQRLERHWRAGHLVAAESGHRKDGRHR